MSAADNEKAFFERTWLPTSKHGQKLSLPLWIELGLEVGGSVDPVVAAFELECQEGVVENLIAAGRPEIQYSSYCGITTNKC